MVQNHSDAARLLYKVLGGPVRAAVTACTHAALLQEGLLEAVESRMLEVHPCHHAPLLSAHDCLHRYLGRLNHSPLSAPSKDVERVMVACQDVARRRHLGMHYAGVPLLFFSNTVVLMLEPPTPASLAAVKNVRPFLSPPLCRASG